MQINYQFLKIRRNDIKLSALIFANKEHSRKFCKNYFHATFLVKTEILRFFLRNLSLLFFHSIFDVYYEKLQQISEF